MPEPLSPTDLALSVYYNRPDVDEDVVDWLDLEPVAKVSADLIERAKCATPRRSAAPTSLSGRCRCLYCCA